MIVRLWNSFRKWWRGYRESRAIRKATQKEIDRLRRMGGH